MPFTTMQGSTAVSTWWQIVNPSKFTGDRTTGPTVKQFLDVLDVTITLLSPDFSTFPSSVFDKAKLILLSSQLDGKAHDWWYDQLYDEEKATYELGKGALERRFSPRGKEKERSRKGIGKLAAEFHETLRTFGQGGRTVDEYINAAYDLFEMSPYESQDNQYIASRFVEGIEDDFTRRLVEGQLDEHYYLDEAVAAFHRCSKGTRMRKEEKAAAIVAVASTASSAERNIQAPPQAPSNLGLVREMIEAQTQMMTMTWQNVHQVVDALVGNRRRGNGGSGSRGQGQSSAKDGGDGTETATPPPGPGRRNTQRFEQGACFKCGSFRHMSNSCMRQGLSAAERESPRPSVFNGRASPEKERPQSEKRTPGSDKKLAPGGRPLGTCELDAERGDCEGADVKRRDKWNCSGTWRRGADEGTKAGRGDHGEEDVGFQRPKGTEGVRSEPVKNIDAFSSDTFRGKKPAPGCHRGWVNKNGKFIHRDMNLISVWD